MKKKSGSDSGIMWKICMLMGGLGFAFCLFVTFALVLSVFNPDLSESQKNNLAFISNANWFLAIGSLASMLIGRIGGWLFYNH